MGRAAPQRDPRPHPEQGRNAPHEPADAEYPWASERFDSGNHEDEDNKTYRGRIISRLRSRLVEGRVEIHWEYRPEFIHRGFVLTAKCRRNEGEWQSLAMEPFQDSGSWIECFKYGESRSYLFAVKKRHHFFFGLFGEEPDEIVYDQISFSVRKGKYLKEKKELMRDRRELLGEVKEYVQAEQEIRRMVNGRTGGKQEAHSGDSRVTKLEKRREALTELSEYIDREADAGHDFPDERRLGHRPVGGHQEVAEIVIGAVHQSNDP